MFDFKILTKDSVTVAVDAVVYFRVFDPVISITNVEDAPKSTQLLAATSLRNVYVKNSCVFLFKFIFDLVLVRNLYKKFSQIVSLSLRLCR